jgi:hypothetical protein
VNYRRISGIRRRREEEWLRAETDVHGVETGDGNNAFNKA